MDTIFDALRDGEGGSSPGLAGVVIVTVALLPPGDLYDAVLVRVFWKIGVIGVVALLGAGAAYSYSGSNTVLSLGCACGAAYSASVGSVLSTPPVVLVLGLSGLSGTC